VCLAAHLHHSGYADQSHEADNLFYTESSGNKMDQMFGDGGDEEIDSSDKICMVV
jgi:hypothetical protein